jgi:valyl-tRNA synthetase
VEREFGTGALKITPGHDPNDFIIGQRHGLAILSIMNKDATLNENAGPYAGLERFAARKKLWADMDAAGLVIKEEPYTMTVPRAQRGGEIIEPLVSRQWFVNTDGVAQLALAAVRSGRITIVPERFTKVYYHWLENLRPWCISRQLWWGHRIPAWYGPDGRVFVARSQAEAQTQAEKHYGQPAALEQDPDVLDTWFSSGLWPFSTLGWPDDTPDLRRFYPTDVMETGYDILFFWVARMIMQGLLFTNDIPFHTIYLHGLVRDGQGRKMSKTFDNVIDPIEVMDEFGADALRFTLLTGSTPGNDMNLSVDRVRANRNFANKIWNATRFVLGNLPEDFQPAGAPDPAGLDLPDRWLLHRLNEVIESATRLFEAYQFGEAGRQAYDFLWGDFADWYIEACKPRLSGPNANPARQTLVYVLDQTLHLLHPFIPFVTEELWQHLPHAPGAAPALIVAAWPQPHPAHYDPAAAASFARLCDVIRAIRNARSEYNVDAGRRIAAVIDAGADAPAFQSQAAILTLLARLDPDQLRFGPAPLGEKGVSLVVGEITTFLPLGGLVDLAAERQRLSKQLAETESRIASSQARLSNPSFVDKAPAAVIAQARQTLAELQAQAARLSEQLANM